MLQCCAAAILIACLGYVLRGAGARGAATVTLTGGLALFAFAIPKFREPVAAILEIAESAGLSGELAIVLRILSLGLLCSVAADICRDMGESGIAERLELCTRAEILLLSLPFLLEVLRLSLEVVV